MPGLVACGRLLMQHASASVQSEMSSRLAACWMHVGATHVCPAMHRRTRCRPAACGGLLVQGISPGADWKVHRESACLGTHAVKGCTCQGMT